VALLPVQPLGQWVRLLAVASDFWEVYSEAIQQRMPQGSRLLHSNKLLKWLLKKPVSVLLVSLIGLDRHSSPQAQMGVLAGLGTR
jgi:hypothetical protein